MSKTPYPNDDPLADLREPEPAGLPAPIAPEPEPAPEPGVLEGEVTRLDAAWHREAVARVVTDWHDDSTSLALLHVHGCGCHYLAARALVYAVGAPVETEPAEDGTEV